MTLPGTPSDNVDGVLAAGRGEIGTLFESRHDGLWKADLTTRIGARSQVGRSRNAKALICDLVLHLSNMGAKYGTW